MDTSSATHHTVAAAAPDTPVGRAPPGPQPHPIARTPAPGGARRANSSSSPRHGRGSSQGVSPARKRASRSWVSRRIVPAGAGAPHTTDELSMSTAMPRSPRVTSTRSPAARLPGSHRPSPLPRELAEPYAQASATPSRVRVTTRQRAGSADVPVLDGAPASVHAPRCGLPPTVGGHERALTPAYLVAFGAPCSPGLRCRLASSVTRAMSSLLASVYDTRSEDRSATSRLRRSYSAATSGCAMR